MARTAVQITYRNMRGSRDLDEEVTARVAWLESFHPRISSCRILLEIPHRHRRRGRTLHVRIALTLAGEEVIVSEERALRIQAMTHHRKSDELDGAHKDAHVAIHDAFDVARRRLDDTERPPRHKAKTRSATV